MLRVEGVPFSWEPLPFNITARRRKRSAPVSATKKSTRDQYVWIIGRCATQAFRNVTMKAKVLGQKNNRFLSMSQYSPSAKIGVSEEHSMDVAVGRKRSTTQTRLSRQEGNAAKCWRPFRPKESDCCRFAVRRMQYTTRARKIATCLPPKLPWRPK